MQKSEVKDTFQQFSLSIEMIDTLKILKYDKPTPIQRLAIEPILNGDMVVGKAQTGSGKTAAFGIPICEKIVWEERYPQALVLEPTRELAVQVQDEFYCLGRKKRLKVPVAF